MRKGTRSENRSNKERLRKEKETKIESPTPILFFVVYEEKKDGRLHAVSRNLLAHLSVKSKIGGFVYGWHGMHFSIGLVKL